MREQVTRLNQDSLNLAKPVARLEIRKNFFSHIVIDLWNTLPHDVKYAKNTIQFKQLYDKNHWEWSGCWFEKNWSYIWSIADHTWRNQNILNIPKWKMGNYFSSIKYYRDSHIKMDYFQVLTPKYAHNFQASNGSFENFHIYDNRRRILKL